MRCLRPLDVSTHLPLKFRNTLTALLIIAMGVSSLCALAPVSSVSAEETEEWTAPAEASAKKNPIAADATSTSSGQAIYHKRCENCHGVHGNGDGPDAADLSIEPEKLNDAELSEQSDGALFWKIQTGKKPMPKYGTRLSEEDIWHVVNYVRTLSKEGAK